jgi:hypothetical protein
MKTDGVPSFSRAPESQPRLIYADTAVAAELLDFVPRVSLIAGLARMVHAMNGDRVGRPALAPVGLDD